MSLNVSYAGQESRGEKRKGRKRREEEKRRLHGTSNIHHNTEHLHFNIPSQKLTVAHCAVNGSL